MGAQLKYSVAVGRVVYPAGTPETADLREVIDARHWTDSDGRVPASVGASSAELDELRALAATEIEKRDTSIAELETALSAANGKVAQAEGKVEQYEAELADLRAQVEELTKPAENPAENPADGSGAPKRGKGTRGADVA